MKNERLFAVALVILGLALAPFAVVEANTVSSLKVVPRTKMVVAGVGGLRDVASGTITLPAFSGKVKEAYLYWHGPTNSSDPNANASVVFNGNPVTGTNIGSSDNNC